LEGRRFLERTISPSCHELDTFLQPFLGQALVFSHDIRHPASYLSARQIAPVTA
jgi:hypothetical protein